MVEQKGRPLGQFFSPNPQVHKRAPSLAILLLVAPPRAHLPSIDVNRIRCRSLPLSLGWFPGWVGT